MWDLFQFWLTALKNSISPTFGIIGGIDLIFSLCWALSFDLIKQKAPEKYRKHLDHWILSEKWRLMVISLTLFVVMLFLIAPFWEYQSSQNDLRDSQSEVKRLKEMEDDKHPRIKVIALTAEPGNDHDLEIHFTFTNSGDHGMKNLRGLVIADSLDETPAVIRNKFSMGMVILKDQVQYLILLGLRAPTPNTKPLYFIRYIKYNDEKTGQEFNEIFAFKLDEIKNGKIRTDLIMLSVDERTEMERKYADEFAAIR